MFGKRMQEPIGGATKARIYNCKMFGKHVQADTSVEQQGPTVPFVFRFALLWKANAAADTLDADALQTCTPLAFVYKTDGLHNNATSTNVIRHHRHRQLRGKLSFFIFLLQGGANGSVLRHTYRNGSVGGS